MRPANEKPLLWGTVVIYGITAVLPLLVVLSLSFFPKGEFSLALYKQILFSPRQEHLLANSLWLAGCTTLLSAGFGIPLGLVFSRTDLPLRKTLAFLFSIPLILPPYITAISWFHVLGRGGLVERLFGASAGSFTSGLLFGLPGCVLVLTSTFMPLVMLLTMAFIRTVHPRIEEAARLVTGWPKILGRITLPTILPGMLLGMMLVFLLSMGEFGVPMFLRYDVFAVESFTRFSAFYDTEAATASAVPLMIVTLLLVVLERWTLRKRTYRLQFTEPGKGALVIPLHSKKWILSLIVTVWLLMDGIPFIALFAESASWSAYKQAISDGGDALLRSLLLATAGATVLLLIGILVGYTIHKRCLPVWQSADTATLLMFAMPGTIIGIGLVTLWNRSWLELVYGSFFIILIGYIAKYTLLTSRTCVSAFSRIAQSQEEAARITGAGWFVRMWHIVLPLARRGLFAAWFIGFLFCMRDLGITMMVYPAGFETLPVHTFTMMANGPPPVIAALCMLMVIAVLVPTGILGAVAQAKFRSLT